MVKVVFFEVEEWERDFIKSNLNGVDLVLTNEKLTSENAGDFADADIVSVFIYSEFNNKTLSKFKNLKLITTRSTGYDHVDLKFCRRKRIKVCNVPHYGENTVAEHAFGLILTLSKNLHKAFDKTREGDFSIDGLKGFDLKGKTLGIVGYGNIGKHVAKIAKGFGMNVLVAFGKKKHRIKGVNQADLKEVLRFSDIITLHVPYSKSTHHLINSRNISEVKPGAIIINTSRGGVLETEALLKALKSKKLGGAGLDVLEEEPLIKEEHEQINKKYTKEELKDLLEIHQLLKQENVVITPHSAFYTEEALKRISSTNIENIKCFIRNSKKKGKLQNIVC